MKKSFKIDGNGGIVTAEIRFIYAAVGVYWAWLYDANDQNPEKLAAGISDDHIPDEFQIGPAGDVVGRAAYIRADTTSAASGMQTVGVLVDVYQGGVLLDSAAPDPVNVSDSQKVSFIVTLRFEA